MDKNTTYQGGIEYREPWVSKKVLADYFGYSVRWVELQMAEGMPSAPFGGRVRFRISVAEDWLIEKGSQ